ncbi:MAG: cyclic-di-AMP receptor [Chloroflexota bacterium]|nr:cyclic-di-AMP receptor [Chloroflexota bacterium]
MKLIVAVVQDYDTDRLLRAVSELSLRATRIASTGGFLRTGNTTVLMGVADEHVASGLEAIRRTCCSRVEQPANPVVGDLTEWYPPGVVEVTVGGAVVFVVPVGRFERYDGVDDG